MNLPVAGGDGFVVAGKFGVGDAGIVVFLTRRHDARCRHHA